MKDMIVHSQQLQIVKVQIYVCHSVWT